MQAQLLTPSDASPLYQPPTAVPRPMKGDDLARRLLLLAAQGLQLIAALPPTMAGKHVASQLLRSVTACGANYEEARGAESKRDFIHKLAITRKEAHETRYWLQLSEAAHLVPAGSLAALLAEVDAVCRILGKSIATARANSPESAGA